MLILDSKKQSFFEIIFWVIFLAFCLGELANGDESKCVDGIIFSSDATALKWPLKSFGATEQKGLDSK